MKIKLGDNIRYLRNRHRLSQAKLGEYLCLSRNQIASYEDLRASPGIKSLIDMANFFDVSIDDLIRGDMYQILKKNESNRNKRNS